MLDREEFVIMTHEEKSQLAEVNGVLNFALWWAETQRDLGLKSADTEEDQFLRGFAIGEVRAASDAITSIKKAITMIEPLWKGA